MSKSPSNQSVELRVVHRGEGRSGNYHVISTTTLPITVRRPSQGVEKGSIPCPVCGKPFKLRVASRKSTMFHMLWWGIGAVVCAGLSIPVFEIGIQISGNDPIGGILFGLNLLFAIGFVFCITRIAREVGGATLSPFGWFRGHSLLQGHGK